MGKLENEGQQHGGERPGIRGPKGVPACLLRRQTGGRRLALGGLTWRAVATTAGEAWPPLAAPAGRAPRFGPSPLPVSDLALDVLVDGSSIAEAPPVDAGPRSPSRDPVVASEALRRAHAPLGSSSMPATGPHRAAPPLSAKLRMDTGDSPTRPVGGARRLATADVARMRRSYGLV
jgi:hypothetical protein